MAGTGSSPRMRGTRSRTHRCLPGGGLIPTYAGNTNSDFKQFTPGWAHPHVCGEHHVSEPMTARLVGSSPRMRGTHDWDKFGKAVDGLIPTYAGNTLGISPSASFWWAHPHVCGEHVSPATASPGALGSSPRMRGTHGRHYPHRQAQGLIPTYAGNTRPPKSSATFFRAHPHVCGEHCAVPTMGSPGWGSSPRMRGTQELLVTLPAGVGLIPTYAGNTSNLPVRCYWFRAHPHVCGEHMCGRGSTG